MCSMRATPLSVCLPLTMRFRPCSPIRLIFRPGTATAQPRAAYLASRSSYDGCRGHAWRGLTTVCPNRRASSARGNAQTRVPS